MDFTSLRNNKQEIKYSFNVMTDDGNLVSAITAAAMDLTL